MSNVRAKITVTNVCKDEFDKACQHLSKSPQTLSKDHVAFFYSEDITYFDIFNTSSNTVVRIEAITYGELNIKLYPRSVYPVENRWLLVALDYGYHLILDKQDNYQVTHQGRGCNFHKYKDILTLNFLQNLLPLGSSQFTAVIDPNPGDFDYAVVLCEANALGVAILDIVTIKFQQSMRRKGYSVLSPTETTLELADADSKRQLYLLKVVANKLVVSEPIDFELPFRGESIPIKKVSDHTATICYRNFFNSHLLKSNLNLEEAKQLLECNMIPETHHMLSIGFIPNSNFMLLKYCSLIKTNIKIFHLCDVINNVVHATQVDTSDINFSLTKILDNGLIFVMRKNGAMQLFRLRQIEEILNLLNPTNSRIQDHAIRLPSVLGRLVLEYCGYDLLVEVLTQRGALESAPVVLADTESKPYVSASPLVAQPVSHESMPLQVSPLLSLNAERGGNKEDKKPEVDVCTEEQANKAAKMLDEGYISWCRFSIFGHHHNDRAIAVRNAIRLHPTAVMKIINHQIGLFNGEPVGIINELGPRWSTLRNKDRAGFYKLLLEIRQELSGVAPTEMDEEKNTCCCLPWLRLGR